ncbi:LysM peptidoglycan-binding domain-containing protein [Microlunatus elymi]|nr:LysM peptidoglycan-binding domain-containing protein [Microlunatus elymi]
MITQRQHRTGPDRTGAAGRLVKGVAALVALLGAVVGVPWLLVELAGNPLPERLDPNRIWAALTTPDDGTVLVGLIAVVGWVAWLVFAISVILEVVAVVSRQRIRLRLPGLGGMQKISGGLVLLVLGMFVMPSQLAAAAPGLVGPVATGPGASGSANSGGVASAPDRPGPVDSPAAGPTAAEPPVTDANKTASSDAVPHPADPVPGDPAAAAPSAGSEPHGPTRPAGPAGPGALRSSRSAGDGNRPALADERAGDADRLVHVVRDGDDLWSLAEQYYGRGQEWRTIARANPSVLSGGPDRLLPGWRLIIPGVGPAAREVRVRPGETLSTIADRVYGDPAAWPQIYHANRSVLADPDLVPIGLRLLIPPGPDPAHPQEPSAGRSAGRRSTGEGSAADPTADAADDDESSQRLDNRRSNAPRGDASAPSRGGDSSAPPRDDESGPPTDESAAPGAGEPGTGGAGASTRPTSAPQPAGEYAEAVGDADRDLPAVPAQLAGVGGLLAAALTAGLVSRRQLQLRARPVGRRIPQPPPAAGRAQADLGRRQLLSLEQLDRALRAIGRDCLERGVAVPILQAARLSGRELDLIMREPAASVPTGFVADGVHWRLSVADAEFLLQDRDLADSPQPYPALVSVGTDSAGSVILVNLEAAGVFAVEGTGSAPSDVLTAMIAELAFVPWSEEMVITVVGDRTGLPESVDQHNVGTVTDLDQLLWRWQQRAGRQREQLAAGRKRTPVDFRVDPDLGDPWVPEVAIVSQRPSPRQAEQLAELLLSEPRVGLSVVLCGRGLTAGARLRLSPSASDLVDAELDPPGWKFTAQLLGSPAAGLIQQLIECTGRQDTEPAPWWVADFPPGSHRPSRARSDAVPVSDQRPEVDHRRPSAANLSWPSAAVHPGGNDVAADPPAGSDDRPGRTAPLVRQGASKEFEIVPSPFAAEQPPPPRHPTLMLLGPIDLIGAGGPRPSRAVLQCIEYAAWLLEHPGSTAHAMAAGLVVAEGTRRSNVSRLRTWLGADEEGRPYLPDAYSGRIVLSALVGSDWHRLQILTGTGVNVTSTEGLCKALDLVRGAPLADAAPTQWHWAEEMRTDMVSVIRDIAVEITERALADSDVDLARWAASRGLTAAPQDEFLMGARIRTEFQAGNAAEVERLALQLAAQGRALGVDLHPDTVDLLQQVMEGRLRARA